MPDIDGVVELERRLEEKRAEIAADLKAEREQLELSLADVGRGVELTRQAVQLIERGETWKTSTVKRIASFYEGQQNSRSRARPAV